MLYTCHLLHLIISVVHFYLADKHNDVAYQEIQPIHNPSISRTNASLSERWTDGDIATHLLLDQGRMEHDQTIYAW